MSEADWGHIEHVIMCVGGLVFLLWLLISGKL